MLFKAPHKLFISSLLLQLHHMCTKQCFPQFIGNLALKIRGDETLDLAAANRDGGNLLDILKRAEPPTPIKKFKKNTPILDSGKSKHRLRF